MASVVPIDFRLDFSEAAKAEIGQLTAAVDKANSITADAWDLANGQDCADRLVKLLAERGTVVLPPGQYVLDGSTVRFPAGSRLIGRPNAWFQLKNSPASHHFFELAPGVNVHGMRAMCMEGPPSGTGAIMLGIDAANVILTDTVLHGPGLRGGNLAASQTGISLWNCSRCRFDRVMVTSSGGGAYGVEIIGGESNTFTELVATLNGADGIKIMGSATYGVPRNMRFLASESIGNGQAIMDRSCPTVTVQAIEGTTVPGAGRWVLSSSASGASVTLPEEDGFYVLYVAPQSTSVRVRYNHGQGFIWAANPKLAYRFMRIHGVWSIDNWTNGEGWDISGVGHRLTDSLAAGNSGGGFQVKPGPIDGSETADLTFTGCQALDTYDGNGFAVVNNTEGRGAPVRLTYEACQAHRNSQAGFAFTTGLVRGVQVGQCQAHGNGGPGMYLEEWCRDFDISGMWAAGNSVARPKSAAGFNWQQRAGRRISARGVQLSGVSPGSWGGDAHLDAACDDPKRATCAGFYLLKDTGRGEVADHVAIQATCHNHVDGQDAVIYASPARLGSRGDFPGLVLA